MKKKRTKKPLDFEGWLALFIVIWPIGLLVSAFNLISILGLISEMPFVLIDLAIYGGLFAYQIFLTPLVYQKKYQAKRHLVFYTKLVIVLALMNGILDFTLFGEDVFMYLIQAGILKLWLNYFKNSETVKKTFVKI